MHHTAADGPVADGSREARLDAVHAGFGEEVLVLLVHEETHVACWNEKLRVAAVVCCCPNDRTAVVTVAAAGPNIRP